MIVSQKEFRHIYDQHIGLLQFYLRKLNVSDDKTDDIIQEAFLRLYRNLPKVGATKIKSYLLVTARNLVIDSYRKESRRKTDSHWQSVNEVAEGMWTSDPQRELEVEMVGHIIDEIAESKGGECFRLFYRDGYSLQEISHKLGEPIGTLASRISRLRNKFRGHIKDRLSEVREEIP